jgi:pimeloyl-ACP methyl ester carboxylesterase
MIIVARPQEAASLGRLIMFDKRNTGLSDRASSDASLEQRMDDVQAVMRACAGPKRRFYSAIRRAAR